MSEISLSLVIPARVVTVVDGYRLVINRGARDGVKAGQQWLVYGISKTNVLDPESGEDLGVLEIVRGVGAVVHVQDKLATLRSVAKGPGIKRTVRRRELSFGGLGPTEEEVFRDDGELLPFEDPEKGDFAKLV